MNQKFTFLFSLTCAVLSASAQVGVGVSGSVNSSAKLQVDATNKGFLPPRVTLTGTNDVATIATPATGLLVYNTATAGTSPNDVTPGIYYFDGSKWQRVINQQPDATVEFNTANPNSTSPVPTFTPNTPASKDYVYVSSVDASQWVYNGTTYVTYTAPASTAWYTKSSTTDAGSNKTGNIYRTGNVGIGTGSMDPAAKLHIVSSSAGGGLRLVDGTQGANKVLSSDAGGNASWVTNVAITSAVTASFGSGYTGNSYADQPTGTTILLAPGKWSVQVAILAATTNFPTATEGAWIRLHFSETSSGSQTPDANKSIGGIYVGPVAYSMISGTVVIHNQTSSAKTYYLVKGAQQGFGSYVPGFDRIGGNAWGENNIIAYPMN